MTKLERELLKKIEALEARIRHLELRPLQEIHYHTYPTYPTYTPVYPSLPFIPHYQQPYWGVGSNGTTYQA